MAEPTASTTPRNRFPGTGAGDAGQAGVPSERLRALPPDRRNRLLGPAEAEFAQHGFGGASLNRILAAASMSKGQAYYYIEDKADLYRVVIERAAERFLAEVDLGYSVPEDRDEFWQFVGELLASITATFLADERLATLARGIYDSADAQSALAQPLGRLRAAMRGLATVGRDLGAVRTDVPESLVLDVVFAASREIDRWFAAHWDELGDDEALEVGQRALSMIRAMCEPPRPGDQQSGSGHPGPGSDHRPESERRPEPERRKGAGHAT